MRESEQYTITEPELQLYNEGKDENYSLPSFASIAARSSQTRNNNNNNKSSLGKPSSMDDTSSTICGSTDESSVTSYGNEPLVKVVDQCYHQFKAIESFEVEYSLTEYESKLYLEDMKNRLDEPIVEELGEDSDDEFDDEDYDYDEDGNDSILSLNTLEKDEFDEFVQEHCKLAPKMGCLGLLQMGLTACQEEEEELNEFYANDDAHLMRSRTEQSSFYDGEASSWGPSEPVGEKFVTNEISFTKDSSGATNNVNVVTGIDLTEAEPVLLGPQEEDEDDGDDDKEKVSARVILETESVSSDWGPGDQGNDDEQDDYTTSVYMGTSSQAPFDETDSLILENDLHFFEDHESAKLLVLPVEPDGIKMRSHKDGKFEIQGFGSDQNGARNAEEFEVLHLEPACEICEA